jgi:putative DNA primase/helicase
MAESEITEDSAALDFERANGGKYLFNATRGQWLWWSGCIWQPDETSRVLDDIRSHCRGYGDPELQKLSKTRAVEGYCRTARVFARTHKDFDADPMLIGTPGGTVDLRTATLRASRPEDGISKSTSVAPAGGDPVRWPNFLLEATGDDLDFVRFLQQVAGYSLTGDIREHCLFFIYGDGGTGKSTYVNSLARIFGAYARIAPMDTFVASSFDRHPTELAMLAGSRLVTANETETGRKWAAARIKSLSGGDPISARFMREDFFTFAPTFKLLFVWNHAPNLQVVDEAMRRRFHVVPFDVKPKKKDPQLSDKLAMEDAQILHWAIQGCLDWQQNGLIVPKRVQEATGHYFSEQDLFTQWFAEKVVHLRDMKVCTSKAARQSDNQDETAGGG